MNKIATNNKLFLVAIFILLFSILAGCVETNDKEVTYVNENNKNDYVIFYNNGEFNAFSPDGETASGTYRLNNNEYILTYRPFGNIFKLKHIIDNKNENIEYITDNKGNKWLRKA